MESNSESGFIVRKLLGLAAVVFLFLFGLLYSRHVQEGEVLYPLRILGEEIEYALIPSEEGKINYRIEQLNHQTMNIRKAAQKGQSDKAAEESKNFNQKSEEIQKRIDELAKTGKDTKELSENLKAVTSQEKCALGTSTQ